MKQLTNTDLKEFAVSLLDKQGLEQYEQFIEEHKQKTKQDPEANGFHNVPAECEDLECAECGRDDDWRESVGCPYMNESTENAESQRIRTLATSIDAKFIVTLPALPPDKWLDNTIEKGWVSVNLAALLNYIADMTE